MLRPLGPGMMQQIQQRCSQCGGTGYATPASDRCPACEGTCLIAEKKVFEVHIEKVQPSRMASPLSRPTRRPRA
jgi:DnaJ family protein A protein 2